MAGDHRLLVGLGDGHRIAQAQLALFHQHGVAEGKQLGILGQPVGHLSAGDLGAAVQVVEVAPLLAGGEVQGEAGGQVAGPVQGRAVSRFHQDLKHFSVVEARGSIVFTGQDMAPLSWDEMQRGWHARWMDRGVDCNVPVPDTQLRTEYHVQREE